MKKLLAFLSFFLLLGGIALPAHAVTLDIYYYQAGEKDSSYTDIVMGTVTWELEASTMDIYVQFDEDTLNSYFPAAFYYINGCDFNVPSGMDYNYIRANGFDNGNPYFAGLVDSARDRYGVWLKMETLNREDYVYYNNLSSHLQLYNIPAGYKESDFFYGNPLINEVYGVNGEFRFWLDRLDENYNPITGTWMIFTTDAAPVPEPATMLLLGSGLLGLAGFRRKLRKR